MHTVQDIETNVAALLTGIDLDTVQDLFGCFERAVSTFLQKADVPETSARQSLFLYDGVTDYPGPTGIFGGALIDLRPQGVDRQPQDRVEKTNMERYDRLKGRVPYGYLVGLEYLQGNQILRISQGSATPRVILDAMSATTGWVAGGNASGLALDTSVYWTQPGALRFNLAALGTEGTLTKTLTTALDLTLYQGVAVGFLPQMLPAAAIGHVTAVKLRLGSSAANYYEVDVTAAFTGAFLGSQFQLIAFDLSLATTVGAPTITAITYVQLRLAYDGTAIANVRWGGLWLSLPAAHDVLFYSPAVFIPNGSTAPAQAIAAVTDSILFSEPAYNVYVREAARAVAFAAGAWASISELDLELEGGGNKVGLYDKYRGSNPSEELRQVDNWYYDD